jgi:prepilin-type N-terminal cleavage/methylation domain-containing protein
MKRSHGFTVIELLIAVVLIGAASVIFFVQKNNLNVAHQDTERKTAINAMYYALEEVYYKTNHTYPATIDATVLPSVDPDLFKDSAGIAIGQPSSQYRYEPTNCSNNTCKSYTLRATLANEADFVKTSRNH